MFSQQASIIPLHLYVFPNPLNMHDQHVLMLVIGLTASEYKDVKCPIFFHVVEAHQQNFLGFF